MNSKGFSLAELLVVVAFIGVLAGVGTDGWSNAAIALSTDASY